VSAHANLIAKLRETYNPSAGWALYTEVQSETGGSKQGQRRADGVLVNLWPSRGGLFYVLLEQKNSMADLGRDLRVPAKAEEIGRFCKERWLVIPPTLKLKERPRDWRVLVVGTGAPYFFDDDKDPPQHPVTPPTDGFLQSLLASGCTAAEEAAVADIPMVALGRPRAAHTYGLCVRGHAVPITWKGDKHPPKVPCISCRDDQGPDTEMAETVIAEADEATLHMLREQIDRRLG